MCEPVEPREELPHFLREARRELFGPHVTVFVHGRQAWVRVLERSGNASFPCWAKIAYASIDDARETARFWQGELSQGNDAGPTNTT